jgi:hypothetical protein
MVVMASGSRAFDLDSAGCNAKLLRPLEKNKVEVWLLRAHPPHQKEVWTRNVLPKHPDAAKSNARVVILKGPRKGDFCAVTRMEGDRVWVKEARKQGSKQRGKQSLNKEVTEHSKFDLVLSLQPRE